MSSRLGEIYDKTNGYCHLCYKKLSWSNYGKHGQKGAWHIEHSKPKSKGGSDNLNNLFPACIPCNLKKGVLATRVIRQRNGITRAPYSKDTKERIKQDHIHGGATLGFLAGIIVGGPITIGLLTLVGAEIGKYISPEK